MTCADLRELLSARIDDEDEEPSERARVDAHLDGCAGCRAWAAAAHDLTRRTRLAPAEPIPDLAPAILAAATAAGSPAPAEDPHHLRLRVALGLVAVLHLALAVPSLLFGDDAGAPVHVAHELGSWDMALSVGFLFAAFRPARAWGMLPLVAALVGSLLLTSSVDVSEGDAGVWREAAHSLELAGLALLWLLARRPVLTRRSGALIA